MEIITKILSRVCLLMKRYFINFLNRFKILICYDKVVKHINFANIVSSIFITFMIYKFYRYTIELDFYNLIAMLISFVVSFVLSYWVLNLFKFSNNLFIAIIQKSVIFLLLYGFIAFILNWFGIISLVAYASSGNDSYKVDINIKGEVPKKPTDDLLKIATSLASKSFETLGASAAGASVASATVKATQGLAIMPRLALIGGSALVTSAGVVFGVRGSYAMADNLKFSDYIKKSIKNSPHANPDINRVPSPDIGTRGFNINDPLEVGDMSSPLTELLDVILSFNVLELILIILLLYILLYQSILKYVNKFIPTKYHNLKTILEKGVDINTKFLNIMLVIVIVLLLIFKLANIFFSYELSHNIDSYVNVYNYIKKS
jgi:hypothetical protein